MENYDNNGEVSHKLIMGTLSRQDDGYIEGLPCGLLPSPALLCC